MMMSAGVLVAIAIVGGVGLVFGTLIALAQSRLRVWEDPRIDEVTTMLPGANCGACGQPGCRAFAESLVSGAAVPATCTVMSPDMRADVATFLGVDVGAAIQRVARIMCAGGTDVAPRRAAYDGLASCAAATAVSNGDRACAWGCLGHGDCAVACTFDAIVMNDVDLPVVDPELCTACGDCVEACPRGLFTIEPIDQHLFVQCRNLLSGEAATSVCSVACNACGRCAQDAPAAVTIERGLAVVHPESLTDASIAAIERCPTSAIVWLHGAQFDTRPPTAGVQHVHA